jgi:uncharacterized protein (TIGR00369 family)
MTETIFDAFPKPPCAELLGWRLIDIDREKQQVRIGFTARPEFLNPAGYVQGGLLAAMLDDVMGPAALVMSEGRLFTSTLDMTVSFLAPARLGPLIGEGTVIQLGKTIGYLQGELRDEVGTLIARATSTARLVLTEALPAAS